MQAVAMCSMRATVCGRMPEATVKSMPHQAFELGALALRDCCRMPMYSKVHATFGAKVSVFWHSVQHLKIMHLPKSGRGGANSPHLHQLDHHQDAHLL